MSVRSIRLFVFCAVGALALTVTAAAQHAPRPELVPPKGPSGPPLPEPLTWTLLTLAATGSGAAILKRKKSHAEDGSTEDSDSSQAS